MVDLEIDFPLKLCINLPHRADRWRSVSAEFSRHGLSVQRSQGVPAAQVRDPWGFQNERRYGCSLAKRLAVRRAMLAGVEAVLIFEDDITFHPEWRERLSEIELPPDWGLFYLGCRHFERPEPVSPWLVRCTRATDNHAFAVRREYFQQVIRGLKGIRKGAPRTILYSDMQLARWQNRIPAYAVYPNLVWQRPNHSDNSKCVVGWYDETGRQLENRHCVEGLEQEMNKLRGVGVSEAVIAPAETLAELPADDSLPSPTWDWLTGRTPVRNLEEYFPFRRYINLGCREDRRNEAEYQFSVHGLAVERQPGVLARNLKSDRGYGKATEYACSLSHLMALRAGWLSGAPAVLIFEDDLILHPRFRQLAEALPLPDDWGIFYFGCKHFQEPEAVAPGILRVKGAWCMHAYAIRRDCIRAVIDGLRSPQPDTGQRIICDVALTRLADRIPTYAAYPNLAWQGDGFSNIRDHHRVSFTPDGHQLWMKGLLNRANVKMQTLCYPAAPPGRTHIRDPEDTSP